MPLYKKTSSKARVKTQTSFLSPLLSNQSTTQNNIQDLLKDDYKEKIPIPTKKKLLEPLINIANDGDLLDNLQQKSFQKSSKTLIQVSKSQKRNLNNNNNKFSGPHSEIDRRKTSKVDNVMTSVAEKSSKRFSKDAKSKESDLSTPSPLLFPSSPLPPPVQPSNKKFKRENTTTVTTKIEISSDTDGDQFKIGNTSEDSKYQIGNLLDDRVKNNARMSQQLLKQDDLNEQNRVETTDDMQSKQYAASNSKLEETEEELDFSLRSILEDIENTNILLGKKIMDEDEPLRYGETVKEKKPDKTTTNIRANNEVTKFRRKKSTAKEDVHKMPAENYVPTVSSNGKNVKDYNVEDEGLESSLRSILDDVVSTNIILSQKIFSDSESLKSSETKNKKKKRNKEITRQEDNIKPGKITTKTKLNSKKSTERSKDNMRASSKSKENIKSLPKPTKINNQKSEEDKAQLFKRIQALCSNEDDLQEEFVISKDVNQGKRKNKSTDAAGKLKQKIKSKLFLEKGKFVKSSSANKSQNNIILVQEHNKDKKNHERQSNAKDFNKWTKKAGGKTMARKKSFTITERRSKDMPEKVGETNKRENNKGNCPPKAKNMIFTSEKSNKLDLNKWFELQEERNVGLYVYCDTCDKVRYLPHCKDPLELPAKWHCYMNPDLNYNKCTDPEYEIEPEKEELIIFNKYHAGSIVWAKMDGYPWWPAMIDDDPNVTDYFWLDGENSTEPSWYHVTFFDSSDVTRAWIRTSSLQPFEMNANNPFFKPKKNDYYRSRVTFAMREAKAACKKEILERLRLYSFVSRYYKKHNDTEKREKKEGRGRPKKSITMTSNSKNLTRNKKEDENAGINKYAIMEENNETCDNLSISSRIAADNDILENLNDFIYSEDAFDQYI